VRLLSGGVCVVAYHEKGERCCWFFRVREAASFNRSMFRCFELEEVMGFGSSSILTSSSNHP